jgi:hypothetical protein
MNSKTNGKGSKRRPTNEKAYRDNYGNIFGQPLLIDLRPLDDEPTPHSKKMDPNPGEPRD